MITPISTNAPAKDDASLIAAWDRARAAREFFDALPVQNDPSLDYSPEEQAQLDIIDNAEKQIRETPATTPRGVEIKLWIALQHSLTSQANDDALKIGDLSWLEANETKVDWIDQLILSAIKSLRAMGDAA